MQSKSTYKEVVDATTLPVCVTGTVDWYRDFDFILARGRHSRGDCEGIKVSSLDIGIGAGRTTRIS
jgi:hypothetical protein